MLQHSCNRAMRLLRFIVNSKCFTFSFQQKQTMPCGRRKKIAWTVFTTPHFSCYSTSSQLCCLADGKYNTSECFRHHPRLYRTLKFRSVSTEAKRGRESTCAQVTDSDEEACDSAKNRAWKWQLKDMYLQIDE